MTSAAAKANLHEGRNAGKAVQGIQFMVAGHVPVLQEFCGRRRSDSGMA
jgi:hypothetical protein